MSAQYEAFGKYVLLEKLATGGMAEVFLARGTGAGGIGKFFAIKRILPQYADSPEFIEMFKDEAKIAINLNHSNIVSIHEFGVEKGQFFLVMDYVEGRNLRQILNKMKKTGLQFSIDQITYMIKEVAGGLDHAHRCLDGSTGKPLNITHRDMSPQNIMVSFEGEVKIVDFGIAKAESQIETTRAGTLKGKFGYMSPEQAEGQQVDLRTDIFSLGIVMWELLAHDRLFVANNEINTLRKIRDCQIPSLRKINPNIHSELERIVQKALARDRNLRYQTGAALHRDLNRFLNRQYPDFSPQDFSVFVKSVFADEILGLRKRLVDYAKINVVVNVDTRSRRGSSADEDDDDETSLLDTNTNSLIVSGTSSDAQRTEPSAPAAEPPDTTLARTERINNRLNASFNPNLKNGVADGMPKQLITPKNKADPSQTSVTAATDINEDPGSISIQTTSEMLPPPAPAVTETGEAADFGPGTMKAEVTNVLDERALAAEMNREIIVNGRPNIPQPLGPDANTGSNTVETEELTPARFATERRTSSRVEREYVRQARPESARLATFIVFSLLCLSAYAYLVKYFTLTMCPVMQITDPVLHGFHNALVAPEACLRTVAGTRPPGDVTPPQPPVPPPPTPPAPPTPTTGEATEPAVNGGEQTGLVVTSNPSGGEIFINGQSTGMMTPSRVNVPSQGTFSIAVRKRGYYDFKRTEVTRESVGHRLDATMQKTNIGYVDVEIFPPQEATLFVNGRAVPIHRNMARDISIPGNVPVRVRAESRTTPTYDEQTISVGVDRRTSIKLNPRKFSRTPANQ